jgi:membrane-associated phospholipid phosphatase
MVSRDSSRALHRGVVTLWLLGAIAFLSPRSAVCQDPGAGGTHLRWWHGVAAVGGYALLTTLDDGLQDFFRENRSTTSNDVSSFARRMGQPEVYIATGLGILATGLISGDREIRDAGIRVTRSLALTGAVVTVAKFAAGRSRPSRNGSDADDFSPFSGNTSAPSGHSAMAFALATSLSDEIGNPWATVALFTLATGTAWSRVNDNVHWVSDVVAGAGIGIVSARFMSGRLTMFGIKPPAIRPAPGGGIALSWEGSF